MSIFFRIHILNRFCFVLIFLFSSNVIGQPKPGEPGSKGTYKAQGYSSVLSDTGSVKVRHYELWYEGVRVMSGKYLQDEKDGLWRYASLSGDLFFQGSYKQNKKSGRWKYFENKKPLCTIYYKNDKRDSTWQSFYENGKIQCVANYSDGKRNGLMMAFYDNSNPKFRVIYKNDTVVDNCISYYRDSIIHLNIECKSGTLYNILGMNDSLGNSLPFGSFKDGNGLLKTYFNDGKISSEGKYKNGLRNGAFIKYANNGEVSVRGEYADGKPINEWIYYDPSGKIINSVVYKIDSTEVDKQAERDFMQAFIEERSIERMPEFQGGAVEMMKFLKDKIQFSKSMKEDFYRETVYVNFIIGVDGVVNDMKVLRGKRYDLNYEAVRVVNLMPPWSPGFQNGFPVDVSYNLPIKFTVQ